MDEKPVSHQAKIVRLGEPRVHINADNLELFDIDGYQCVVRKGEFRPGDLAVYIQPDSVVPLTKPFEFLEGKTRITVRRFRKEWSEGLLLPITDFPSLISGSFESRYGSVSLEGADVSDFLGITHYEGDQIPESTGGLDTSSPVYRYPKTLKGWFYFILFKLGLRGFRRNLYEALKFDVPKFDVESIKNFPHALQEGERVIVTEKLHGSQCRYVYKDGQIHAGSRNFWKAKNSPCVWRKALEQNSWIETWCRGNEGDILYGEVVPTQKGFTYGCKPGEIRVYIFDIRDKDGNYLPKEEVVAKHYECDTVPVLYYGSYDRRRISSLIEGTSALDGKTQREGIVITAVDQRTIRGLGRIQLKWKSNTFLEKEGNR